jgi:undecaprenyl diphosphate synthase
MLKSTDSVAAPLTGTDRVPRHVAIIMDGNGRWARQRGMPRIFGHRQSRTAVRETVEKAGQLGIDFLTLYTFSSENWQRPRAEVSALMEFLELTLLDERNELDRNNVQLRVIGHVEQLPERVRRVLHESVDYLAKNTGLTLVLALSYGGRDEIVDAARQLARSCVRGELQPEAIQASDLGHRLYTADLPDPDLLIRTGGEMRISNFLLWQLAYAEIYVTRVMWPDFRGHHLVEAIEEYGRRERRFGRVE